MADTTSTLVEIYEDAAAGILLSLERLASSEDFARKATIYNQILRQLAALTNKSNAWVGSEVANFFEEALRKQARDLYLPITPPIGSVINQVAIQALAEDLSAPLANVTESVAREAFTIYNSPNLARAYPEFDREARRLVAVGMAQGQATVSIKKEIQKLLKKRFADGIVAVPGRDGRTYRFSIPNYAQMVAHNIRRRAMSEATIALARQQGNDLVRISPQPSSVGDWCNLYAGTVWSISGTHPTYPPLSQCPNGGCPLHPRCKHSLSVFEPDFYTAQQRKSFVVDTKWRVTPQRPVKDIVKDYWKTQGKRKKR